MKSKVADSLPLAVRRSLRKFGADLAAARKRRRLTVAMMVERLGVAKSTYLRAEKGDPTVSLGVYAMALFALGLSDRLKQLADSREDDVDVLFEAERLPKRVRLPKPIGIT